MQRSAKAGILLAVLKRCDVAWKKQQPGGTRAWGELVPRFRRALAAPLPCSPSILASHLRLPLSLLASGQASIRWKRFLPGNKPSGLAGPVSSRGL